jgi:hypothetical protein
MALRQGIASAALGILLGLLGAALLTKLIATMLSRWNRSTVRRSRRGPPLASLGTESDSERRDQMSERHKTHNGRDLDGKFRVRQADVEDVLENPDGADIVRDDVRLGGAIADVGPHAGEYAKEITEMIDENRDDVSRLTGKSRDRSRNRGNR